MTKKKSENVGTYLTVMAVIQAKKGHEAKVRKLLRSLIPPTLREKGCVDYELHLERGKPGHFLFYENWLSKAYLDKHLAADHLKQFDRSCRGLLAKPVSITLWRRIA